MSTETNTLACLLTDAQMTARRILARDALLAHVAECRLNDLELIVEFADAQEIRSEVERFIELEKQCCGFLSFAVSPPGGRLTVRIEGPAGSQPVLRLLADALSAGQMGVA